LSSLSNNYTILCVDDNQNNLFTLNALLSSVKNINSIEVLGGKEALDILLTTHVDLILCDVQMPDINGFELAKMIKSNKKTKHIPIIFVTAVFKSEEFIKQGFELGAVDYVTKPIDDNQLLNKITLYLKVFDEKNRVAQSEKRLNDVVQSIGDGIYTLDMNHKATFVNNEALSLLGFTYNELVGKRVHDIIHYKDRDNNQILSKICRVHHAMHIHEEYRNENEALVKKDGTFLDVSIVAKALHVEKEVVGTVVIFRDKTEHNKLIDLEEEKLKNQEQVIHHMVNMIESRDAYTAGHTKRVANYCELIAKEMNFSDEEIELVKKAAWLHDIGKISTPDSILLKPGKLSNIEYEFIQDHLNSGYEILKKVDAYADIADIMREHHEKYDGSGYPRGLKSNEIKPLSRIMIVADAFDAMTTNRVYKPRKSISVALQELQDLSAHHFHPEVVSAAVKALGDINIDTTVSQLPQSPMEAQRFAYFYKDRLTNLFIIDYISLILRYHLDSDSAYVYDIQLSNFTKYNKKYSWAKGDDFLVEFANYISSLYKDSIAFRVEGDDFLILSKVELVNIEKDLSTCSLFKDSIVGFKVTKDYVDNVKKNNYNIFDKYK